jgi:uncharacterized protein
LDHGYPHSPVLEDADGIPEAAVWAAGFLRVLELRLEDWAAHAKHPDVSGLASALMGLVGNKAVFKKPLSDRERDEIVRVLPRGVAAVHHLWRGRANPFIETSAPAHTVHKVGRNEPCPCGSGKKYKRCCGSPEKLAVN